MAKHLPDPAGEPDRAAQAIIDAIEAYLTSDRDEVTITRGLRHIYHRAERAWDASVAEAKKVATFAEIMAATGDSMGTLQGRIRAHRAQLRKQPRGGRHDPVPSPT